MLVFLLILLVLAAAAGVLGAVIKATLVLVLSLILAVVLLVWIGTWYAKHRMREFRRAYQDRGEQDRRRREAYDIGSGPSEDPAPRLGDGR